MLTEDMIARSAASTLARIRLPCSRSIARILRERGLETQVVGIARIDPAHQWLHQPLERLASQPAADECRQAFLGLVIPPGNDQVHQHPQLAAPGEDRCCQDRYGCGAEPSAQSLPGLAQLAFPHNERAAVAGVGFDELVRQP